MSASFSANAGSSQSSPVPSAPHSHFWPDAAYATQPSARGSTWTAPAPCAPSRITGTSSSASAAGATSPPIQLTCDTATSVVSGPTASGTWANGTERTVTPRSRAYASRSSPWSSERRSKWAVTRPERSASSSSARAASAATAGSGPSVPLFRYAVCSRTGNCARNAVASMARQTMRMTDRVIANPGVLLYTRIKKSPYYYGARRHGVALYSVYNHHYHPRHYGDPFQEYWQLLEGVTLWDVGGAERQVEITGPDAFTFTNMLTPRDLNQCAVGQCKYAFITDERGGIINDPVLLRLAENHFWLSLADSDVLLWCKGLAYHSGLDVQISEPDVAPLQVQGPKSKEVMTDLFGADILDVPYYYMVERELDGMRLVISRTGYTGELGYELYLHDASRHEL